MSAPDFREQIEGVYELPRSAGCYPEEREAFLHWLFAAMRADFWASWELAFRKKWPGGATPPMPWLNPASELGTLEPSEWGTKAIKRAVQADLKAQEDAEARPPALLPPFGQN